MADPLHVIVLAAGEGKRMKSLLPKVLLPLAGRPLLAHVLDTARALRPEGLHVVYGHRGEQLRAAFTRDTDIHWVHQLEQLGKSLKPNTSAVVIEIAGDAVEQARQLLEPLNALRPSPPPADQPADQSL